MQFCYQSKNMKSFLIALVFFSGICVNESGTTSVRQRENGDQCPLWHIRNSNGDCECGARLSRVISCHKKFIYVDNGYCLTWNNLTNSKDLYRCLFTPRMFRHTSNRYSIPINMSGEELNYRMCSSFNRQGMQCGQCISGYGPAVFSDSVTCADCSKHKYLWILNLMFQLTMVTLMCLVFMIFQIKGTSSPLNIIIAYIQNIAFQYELSGLYYVQYFGQKVNAIFATILGIWNLDYFRFVLPPLCISNLLLVVHSYNDTGQRVSKSEVLLFDPSIRFLHSEHLPYASIALFVLLTCIIPPPILLVLHPSKFFKKCIGCLGFQRWDVLHHIMDVFQGWFKDGTEGTVDYKFLSAFFLILQIAHGGKSIVITLLVDKKERMLIRTILGIVQVSMGVLFFVLKPYKKVWMTNVDGIIFTLAGCYILIGNFQ